MVRGLSADSLKFVSTDIHEPFASPVGTHPKKALLSGPAKYFHEEIAI